MNKQASIERPAASANGLTYLAVGIVSLPGAKPLAHSLICFLDHPALNSPLFSFIPAA